MYLDNEYSRTYYSLISRAQTRASTRKEAKKIFGYVERHHIIPESLGGPNTKENLVFLSGREHFVCHLLLTKMLTGKPKYQMIKAAHLMTVSTKNHTRHKCSSRIYEMLKREAALAHSVLTKGKPKHTASSKETLSRKATGRPSAFKNKSHTQSSKDLLSLAQSKPCVSPEGQVFKSTKEAALFCGISAVGIRVRIASIHNDWRYLNPEDQQEVEQKRKPKKSQKGRKQSATHVAKRIETRQKNGYYKDRDLTISRMSEAMRR